jgi:ribosomal protein L36
MKVRASVKKRSPSARLYVKRLYVINKRILDLKQDKDSYGKRNGVKISRKQERCYNTYIFG